MKKPIIGITVDCEHDADDPRTRGKLQLNWNYAQEVADAGGVPLIVPPMADMKAIANIIDGWLIPGGNDIDAAHFGQENHPKVDLQDPERFEGEKRLFEAVSSDLPVLGICYGCQFLNVVRGGDLIQHLPDIENTIVHTGGQMQSYRLEAGSKLSHLVGTRLVEGKSYHHQAVHKPAGNLQVVAWSEDGTVEALEATDRPWMIGVQWHPERTPDDGATQKLFKEFVQAAAAFAESRSAVSQ